MSTKRYFFNSFVWASFAKISDAAIKFFTIPILLRHFGKESYGIISLALATNAYLGLLDLGINTGAVKFFSQWIAEKKADTIQKAFQCSLAFYLAIGTVNLLIMLGLAAFGQSLFNVLPDQFQTFRILLVIVGVYSIVNWTGSVLNQLLVAAEQVAYIQKVLVGKTIANLGLVFATLWFSLSIESYFAWLMVVNSTIILPFYFRLKAKKLITKISYGGDWSAFTPILKYSLAIFSMGIFQFTATESRPIILGIFNTSGVGMLTEYKVIEVFPIFLISLGGMFISILMPKATRVLVSGNKAEVEHFAYQGTILTTSLVALMCFPIILCSREILTLYVGTQYAHLAIWLSLWVSTLVLYLYNSPVSSLVLASGKTRMLVYSSATACLISMLINAGLCRLMGVGSAVIGYLVYITIQMSFYYIYFNRKVLQLNSFRIFKAFFTTASLAAFFAVAIHFAIGSKFSNIPSILIKSALWYLCFFLVLFALKIISLSEIVGFMHPNKNSKAL